MAIDKKYINYNLSLVDPNNINVPTTPLERKEPQIKIEVETPSEQKDEKAIEIKDENIEKEEIEIYNYLEQERKIETPLSIETLSLEKEEINVSSYVEIEKKAAEGEEGSKIEIFEGTPLRAKAFPIDPIVPEFNTRVVKKEAMETEPDYMDPNVITKESMMENFYVHGGNQGKDQNKRFIEEIESDFEIRILDQKNEKEKEKGSPSLYNTKTLKRTDKGKDDSVDIMDLSPFNDKEIVKTPYLSKNLTYKEALKTVSKKGQISNLGAIHVYPINLDSEGGISAKYIIPFEFNPKFSESGVSAKYETSSLLSRVGDIHSYIKTESSSVQLNTQYQVLSPDEDNDFEEGKYGDNGGVGSWMKSFTLRNVQSIEMAFRGLVYPQTSKEEASFFRPPVVKLVFGNANESKEGNDVDSSVPFNNLLTYPYKMGRTTKIYHKSFIVSKVDIKKDWDNYPVILNKKEDGIIDLQGFSVSLSLLEIDPMYIGVLPSFEDYYSIVPTINEV